MKTIKLDKGDYLAVDSCYLSETDRARLVVAKTFDVDDGDYMLVIDGQPTGAGLGVDSGNITMFQAPQAMTVESDSGLSGEIILAAGVPLDKCDFIEAC